jgi:hypothetical protein
MGLEGDAVRLPVSVTDENKPQTLQAMVPVVGTPIKIRLERYLPDVKWETTAADDPNGGPVAKLSLRGESLSRTLALGPRSERQSISLTSGASPSGVAAAAGALPQELRDRRWRASCSSGCRDEPSASDAAAGQDRDAGRFFVEVVGARYVLIIPSTGRPSE